MIRRRAAPRCAVGAHAQSNAAHKIARLSTALLFFFYTRSSNSRKHCEILSPADNPTPIILSKSSPLFSQLSRLLVLLYFLFMSIRGRARSNRKRRVGDDLDRKCFMKKYGKLLFHFEKIYFFAMTVL